MKPYDSIEFMEHLEELAGPTHGLTPRYSPNKPKKGKTVTTYNEALNAYFESLQKKTEPHRTHLMEILALIRAGLGHFAHTESANYEGDFLKLVIKFADKKRYEISVREIPHPAPETGSDEPKGD